MKHTTYFNLLDAIKENGCPICFIVEKSIHKFMDDFLYEQINDPYIRKGIRFSLGFCNHHSWKLQKFGDALGISIIYQDLFEIILNKINEINRPHFNPKSFFKNLLKDENLSNFQEIEKTCLICKKQREVEQRYIATLIENFKDEELSQAYKNSFGFCLPHSLYLIRHCKNLEVSTEFIRIEFKKIEDIINELKEFQRKYDYRFSSERFGKEKDCWIRAIEKMLGKEGIY